MHAVKDSRVQKYFVFIISHLIIYYIGPGLFSTSGRYPVEDAVKHRSDNKCKQGGKGQSEHDGGCHTAEGYVKQQGNATEDCGQCCHEYRTGTRHRSFDNGLIVAQSAAFQTVGLVEQYDNILDDHTQQTQPSCNAEESELETGHAKTEYDTDD